MSNRDDEPISAATPAGAWARPSGGRASSAEAAEFAGHLAGLTRTGLPLPSGLRALAAELPTRRLRPALLAMADRLEAGESLDAAMVGLAARFPERLRGLMVAGARSGRLGDVLGQYVRHADLGADLRRRFWMAVGYPLFLLAAVAGLGVFVCLWIVTAFQSIVKDFGIDVPAITRALFWVAAVVRERGPAIGLGASVAALTSLVAFRFMMDAPTRRMAATAVPLFGPILRWSALAEFCHLTALLVEAETPLPEAIALASRGVGDAELERAGATLEADARRGRTLADALASWPRCPAGLIDVLGDSEGRGDLAPSLHLAGDMFEARARTQASFGATLFSAAALLAVIWGIGFVIVGLYLPLIGLLRRLA